jgi:hypothetical protein
VTVPFAFTVYVPWFAIVNEVCVQLFGVCALGATPHNFTVDATNGAVGSPGVSLVNGEIVWFVSQFPVFVSGLAVGARGARTVGVIVVLAT